MPELPEVEVVRQGLQKNVVGRTIDKVSVLHPRAVRRHLAGPADFAGALAGRPVGGARRRLQISPMVTQRRRRRCPYSACKVNNRGYVATQLDQPSP